VELVKKQRATGVDIISDGEFGKSSWSVYILDRIDGFSRVGPLQRALGLSNTVAGFSFAGRSLISRMRCGTSKSKKLFSQQWLRRALLTGRIERIVFNLKMREMRRESLLTELHQCICDVRQGARGYLYLLTEEKDGAAYTVGRLPENDAAHRQQSGDQEEPPARPRCRG